uniref:uncharacterized protein LOC105350069 n=1 Tax=Fragaria vesca subsp. vesca TaxID=101020 RepID=UPI0005CB4EE0|nr:PREDICTED: uncharacterized protein LOC105350069 [Fragaria vesca subsp. vesca]
MPFGLKNVGATYQRLVNHMFANLIGNTMEVYVNDMLVKSTLTTNHAENLEMTFKIMREYGMKLNSEKCTFGVHSGKFLGFMGAGKNIDWTDECEKAFISLKEHIGKAPIHSKPKPGKVLLIYLSVSITAISSAFIREEEKHKEAIYYVSKGFADAESRYPEIKKLALALVTSARKRRPYFKAHTIKVMTNQPLKQVLWKPETSGRLVKRAVELGEFDIHYCPCTAVKGQVIADFILKFTGALFPSNEGDVENTSHPPRDRVRPSIEKIGVLVFNDRNPIWTIYVDGSSNQARSGAGLVLTTPQNDELKYALRFNFKASNNEVEYEALIAGLRIAKELEATQVRVHSDSQLMVNQVLEEFQAKDPVMAAYLSKVKALLLSFMSYNIVQIPREQNEWADALARLASTIDRNVERHTPIEYLNKPSIKEEPKSTTSQTGWTPSSISYLRKRYPTTPLRQGRRGYFAPYLRCVALDEGRNVLSYIHEGICGNHSGARSLALKTLRQGTTPCTSTKETPFSLAYGSEALLPIELKTFTHCVNTFNVEENDQQLRFSLDLLEERRENAEIRWAAYQQHVTKYYNQKVKEQSFQVGDLVLKKVTLPLKERPNGTLGANWERPYRVIGTERP